jgi:hypothetical protein
MRRADHRGDEGDDGRKGWGVGVKINWENILWYMAHYWVVWPSLALLIAVPLLSDLTRFQCVGWYGALVFVGVLVAPLMIGSREHDEWCQEVQRQRDGRA